MSSLISRSIRSYQMRDRIGSGGQGEVYKAYQPSVERDVAIKIILPQYGNQPEFVRRFEVEAQIIARLEHPHIVPLYDYWRDPEGAYLVMRWLPNNLKTVLVRGAWKLESAARLLDQLAAALTAAHREGVIHRDIKPANILLDEDENVYLADFGIAQDVHSLPLLPSDGLIGSPEYITPEAVRNQEITPRTDLYSLGYVMYEVLTGEKPFPDATTSSDYIVKHLNSPMPMMSIQYSGIPAALDEVLQTATAKDPAQRYANALRFAAAFRAAIPSVMPRIPSQPLANPLTERELDVLKLMVDGLDNVQISAQLFLTAGTVKWYVKQIYSKLDAHSRAQAIDRTHNLRLLERTPMASLISIKGNQTDNPRLMRINMPVTEPENPYKGLRAFQESDSSDFYGRAALTELLLSRLSENSDGGRLLVVVGPSGSGKSSVIRAGLIPALRHGALHGSPRPFIIDMLPGTHPFEELEAALLRIAVSPQPELMVHLREDRRGLVRAARRILPNDPDSELILVIDQFEELFTLVEDNAVRMHFIDNLLSAVTDPRGRVRVILTLRADFYDRPLMIPRLAELMRASTETVIPMNLRELEQAITAPVERVGLRLENGLVTTILNDVGEQPGTLPLLQYALTELYERREGLTLTLAAYQAMGGVTGALARRADELFSLLDAATQASVEQMFLRLVTLGEGTEDTRRRTLRMELLSLSAGRQMDEVIDMFVSYRLLTLDHDLVTRTPTVEIAHEALIREWGRLREWLNNNREDVRVQRRLAQASAEWQEGHDNSYLASGAKLEQFELWARDTSLLLTKVEQAYLTASLAEREIRIVLEREQETRERNLERTSRRFLRALVVVLFVALVGAFSLTGIANGQRNIAVAAQQNAERSAAETQSIALTIGAQQAIARSQPDIGLRLALEAIDMPNPPTFAKQMFFYAAHNTWILQRYVDSEVIRLADTLFHPDGQRVMTTSFGKATLWDMVSGQPLQSITVEGRMLDAVFHPDGHTAAITGNDGILYLWNLDTNQVTYLMEGDTWHSAPQFNRTGTLLLTSSSEGIINVWDWDTRERLRSFSAHDATVTSIHFNLDETQLVTTSLDGTVKVWDFERDSLLQTFTFPNREDNPWIWQAQFLLDGERIIFGGDDIPMVMWRWRTNSIVWQTDSDVWVQDLALSPDGMTFVVGLNAQESEPHLQQWGIETGTVLRSFGGHSRTVGAVDISSDGQTMLSASSDNTAALWTLQWEGLLSTIWTPPSLGFAVNPVSPLAAIATNESPAEIMLIDIEDGTTRKILEGHRGGILTMAFSPDGRLLLSGDYAPDYPLDSQSVYVWDVETGEMLNILSGFEGWILSIAFSPDGRVAAIGEGQGMRVTLWDIESGTQLATLSGNRDWINSLTFSPDGQWLYGGLNNGEVIQWNATSGERLQSFAEHPTQINDLVISHDGARIAAAGRDHKVWIYDAQTGELLITLEGHQAAVESVHYSSDDLQIITSSGDGMIIVWDALLDEPIRGYNVSMPGDEPYIQTSIVGDGQRLLSFDGIRLMTWDASIMNERIVEWVNSQRYIPELTCQQRDLYQLPPYCPPEENASREGNVPPLIAELNNTGG